MKQTKHFMYLVLIGLFMMGIPSGLCAKKEALKVYDRNQEQLRRTRERNHRALLASHKARTAEMAAAQSNEAPVEEASVNDEDDLGEFEDLD